MACDCVATVTAAASAIAGRAANAIAHVVTATVGSATVNGHVVVVVNVIACLSGEAMAYDAVATVTAAASGIAGAATPIAHYSYQQTRL